ncbi:NADH-quinone oxidoreductase [Betaproteobacteria bacterium]|nr:NADH-quinone oxidoreductase [Betaproteobacteria bacterium]GHU22366.1 NADH-quinone oxidoreductase [Betaproteobacteria bacterium]
MLEIEIDGKAVQVPDGCTVMDAATVAGVHIPHFCYHKKLSIAASCRMCLVQVEKAPKPLPACATPVTGGMKVWTQSEAVVKAQRGVMEFLLINHPLDCPICDQGGECQLQDIAVGYGDVQSRYQEEKRVVFNKNFGPLVSSDASRCINCTRCVRFTTEIAGLMELGQANRSEHAEIMTFVERTIDSELSGNLIDLCPVGALTSKPFRFSARSWELSRLRSVSPHDALGTNLIVQTRHDKVKRVLPFENSAVNDCWLSDKDRFSYEALASDARLTQPLIRQGETWQEVGWQEALEFVATHLQGIARERGGDAIGALASPHSTVEELFLLQKLVRGLGSQNVDFRLRQSDFRADPVRAGAPWLGMAVADVDTLDRLLVIGSFLRKDAPLLAQRVRQAVRRNGLQVSAVGPNAEDWLLPVRERALVAPADMVDTLAGIAVALAAKRGEALAEALVEDVAARVGGEPSAAANAIAENLASGEKVALWLGNLAVQHARGAELQVWAQEIARLGGGSFGFIGEAANSVGGYLAGAVPGAQGADAQALIRTPRAAYVLLGAEPALDFADGAATEAALGAAALVVALGAFDAPSIRNVADVMLPITPFSETAGTFVNCEGRVQSFNAVVQPLGNARPGWKVLRVLGNLLEISGFSQETAEAVRDEALGDNISARLDNAVTRVAPARTVVTGLQRVADVPIHFADPLVRHAPSLQKSGDAAAPVARMAQPTLDALGLNSGDRVRVSSGAGQVELTAVVDDGVARGCVRVAAAHPATVALGPLVGELSVERV